LLGIQPAASDGTCRSYVPVYWVAQRSIGSIPDDAGDVRTANLA
jgi:hypothetical protein